MPRLTALGVHPLAFSPAILREIVSRSRPDDSDSDIEEECRSLHNDLQQTMESLHLIELAVDDAEEGFTLDRVSQDSPMTDRSQVPYDEHWLSADGNQCIANRRECPSSGSLRVAFYLHRYQPDRPLHTPWGVVRLVPQTPLPERLRRLAPYDPPL